MYIVIPEIIFKKSKLIRKIIETQKQSKDGRKQNVEQVQIKALSKSRFKHKYVSNIITAISNTKIKMIDWLVIFLFFVFSSSSLGIKIKIVS